jgi:Coenzyme PQQ synthesis protein D (PqqD)
LRAKTYRQIPGALSRRVGADVLVLPVSDPNVHELSGGAADVWRELAEARTGRDLLWRLAETFGAEPDAMEQEVDACLARLLELGVIGVVDEQVL